MSNNLVVSKDPFGLLLDINRQCKTYGRPLPGSQSLGRTWQGIGFISANQHFVAPLKEVKEIITVPMVTPLPSAAEWFFGFANLRGRLLPITDLEKFVQGTTEPLSPLSRVIVVEFEQSGVGFLVQQVLGVQRFSETTLQKPSQVSEMELPTDTLQGEFNDARHKWQVLSLQALSQTSQFYHVVKESEA